MISIKEAIIVEGNYDKIKLSQIFDTTIVVLDGYMIYKDKKRQNMIKMLADKCGVIVFTDSDMAGFRIRTFLKNILSGKNVKHAYIPDIYGKEKRKAKPSKEGMLGVEGMSDDIIIEAIEKAIGKNMRKTDDNDSATSKESLSKKVTKTDLFADGLSGGANSSDYRHALTTMLELPHRISPNMLLDVINRLYTYDEYKRMVDAIKAEKSSLS